MGVRQSQLLHTFVPLALATAKQHARKVHKKRTAEAKGGARKPRKPKPTGSKRSAPAAWKLVLAGRLQDVFGNMTTREIADATGHNRETVRRFLASGSPSVAFLVDTSRASGVSVDWLLGLRSAKH